MTDIDAVIDALTLDEKCALTSGADMWSTPAVQRLGIPSIKMTDGPSGARGGSLPFGGDQTSVCLPCGSALGATWDPSFIEEAGALIAEEARTKSCRVLLGPTLNLHRSPLGGRNFEGYSEDPLLSGRLAAAFVRGARSRGVAAAPKHFVANDAEFERLTIRVSVDERTLRELYLLPFELAVRDGGALAVMSAYSRVNGTYCSDHAWLLGGVLKSEWGFDGIVITDWFAAGSTVGAARAGLDVEMPGPARFFGAALAQSVRAGDVDEELVDEKVRRLLGVIERLGAFSDPLQPDEERSVDRPEHRALARRCATESTVLLRNDGLLPFEATELQSIAVIGPNVDRSHIMGGGSASLRPHYIRTPLEALRARLGNTIELMHEPGCTMDRNARPLSLTTAGFDVTYYEGESFDGPGVHGAIATEARWLAVEPPSPGMANEYSMRARGTFTPSESGTYKFTLAQSGRARLVVGGETVLDGFAEPPAPGDTFFGMGSQEVEAAVNLEAGIPVDVLVEYSTQGAGMLRGLSIGCRPPVPGDLLTRAEHAAAAADAVVLVVGTSDEWETEGRDRESMSLPGSQDELIDRVLAANPRTVVVINAGAPVAMPWADRAAAILQIWLGGQEMADGLADVLFGDAEPGGRLPTTIPLELEHNPSYGNFPGEAGEVRYGEGLLVGYRWYDSRRLPVRYPFGHGLSYTTFELGAPSASSLEIGPETITVRVPVTNTGRRIGSLVVQCYVSPVTSRLFRPAKELKAFAKVHLEPGECADATLELDLRAFAYWDPGESSAPVPDHPLAAAAGRTESAPGWCVDAGDYELHIGTSVDDITHVLTVTSRESLRVDAVDSRLPAAAAAPLSG